ncbi:MAG: hypothetical protein AB9866_21665 [Syntrophobacteraceae bacterium]
MIINIGISLAIDAERTLEYFERMRERLRQLRPAFLALDPIIRNIVRANFAAGGRPRWKPRKGERKYGGMLMRKSGHLYNAALNPALETSPDRAHWTAAVGEAGVAQQHGSQKLVVLKKHTRTISEAFGKALSKGKTSFDVKSHTVRMDLPARPFFTIPVGYGEPERIRSSMVQYIMQGQGNHGDTI